MPASEPPDVALTPPHCIDCGQQVAEDLIFRVLRRDRAGRRHVVCQPCADRRHAEATPTPIQVQRTAPTTFRASRRPADPE